MDKYTDMTDDNTKTFNLYQEKNDEKGGMIQICKSCSENLSKKGIVCDLYFMICDYSSYIDEPIPLHESHFIQPLRYLELNRYIITCEVFDEVIMARPNYVMLDDGETKLYCSGTCSLRNSQERLVQFDFKQESD
jgi:hypothetical protein